MASNPDTGVAKAKKGGRDSLLLLISLLLAFLIWFIHNMSLSYSSFLEYRVEVKTDIEGRAQTSRSDDILIIRGKADGFYILLQRLSKKKLVIKVETDHRHFIQSSGDVFLVSTNEIKGDIIQALGNEVDMEFIVTESLQFLFPEVSSKKVKIVPNYSISCKSQYMQVGEMFLRPDSVVINGEKDVIGPIDSILTESISLSQADRPEQGMVKIRSMRGVTYSLNEILYDVDIERYVEESVKVPIITRNVPGGKNLIVIPSEVTVTYRKLYGVKYDYTLADFVYTVDYNDYLKSIDSKVVPSLQHKPDDVFSISVHPPFVDCIFIND